MPGMVLDSSMTLAWFLPDEQAAAAVELMDRVTAEGALVPTLWPIEVGNAFLNAERRGRITAAERSHGLRLLGRLPIEIDGDTGTEAWSGSFELAERYDLTLYDAVYLELAIRRGLPLASLDAALCRAAQIAGAPIAGG